MSPSFSWFPTTLDTPGSLAASSREISAKHPVSTSRALLLARCRRRASCRDFRAATCVTVHVFTMIVSASAGSNTTWCPAAASCLAIVSISFWVQFAAQRGKVYLHWTQ